MLASVSDGSPPLAGMARMPVTALLTRPVKTLRQARFPQLLGADFGSAQYAGGMAGDADLVIDLLAGQLDFSARWFGYGNRDPRHRLDALDHGDFLARTVVGRNPADDPDQGGDQK